MNGEREGLVLVTGSSGFIGRALVARLTPRFDVVALDRSCPAEPPPGVDWSRSTWVPTKACAPPCSR